MTFCVHPRPASPRCNTASPPAKIICASLPRSICKNSTAAATGELRASTGRCSTRPACASTPRSPGTASRCCCNRAPWVTPAMCSRAKMRCARFAASIRSTTTTAFRLGRLSRTGRSRMSRSVKLALSLALLLALAAPALAQSKPRNYGIGHAATPEQIAGWDIDVRPDGQGAPPGHGSVKEGEKVYLDKCAACHGEFGESAGRWPQLAQGKGTLASSDPVKTVGSDFPYLSSVFDYIRRAMPFGAAQSLSNDELYAVTAYVLNLNDIVDDKFVLSKQTWGQVKMPNQSGFFDDDRDKAEKAFWAKPCMNDCRPPVKITGRARAVDVTPDDKGKKQGGVE